MNTAFNMFKDNLNALLKRKKNLGTSGFNTMAPYSNRHDNVIISGRNSSDSALVMSIDLLMEYISDLSEIRQDRSNHDLILKNRIAISKLNLIPVLPGSFRSKFEIINEKFCFIYQMIIIIFESFMNFQDVLEGEGIISPYCKLLENEKDVLVTLRSIILKYFLTNSVEGPEAETYSDLSTEFHILVIELTKQKDISTWNRTVEEIVKNFNLIDQCNQRICRRLLPLYKIQLHKKTKTGVTI